MNKKENILVSTDIQPSGELHSMELTTLQVHKSFSSNKITDKGGSQLQLEFQHVPVVVIEICNCAKYYITTPSFYQEVYRCVTLPVREQIYASDLSIEEDDIVSHAEKLRHSSEQLQFQHGQKKICPFGGDIPQLNCPLPFALDSHLNKVYRYNNLLDNDQLNGAYKRRLYRFKFSRTSTNKSEREEEF